jgi:neutral ceramidase
LAKQALAGLDRVEKVRLSPPRIQQRLIELSVRAPRSPEELQALRGPLVRQREAALQAGDVGQARTLETALQGVDAGARRTAVAAQQSIEALVAVAVLGDVALASIPGELYYQLGSHLRHAHQCRALVLAYTNGYIGYIPTQDAYDAIDYEVLMTRSAPGSGEFLRGTALQLLAIPDGG